MGIRILAVVAIGLIMGFIHGTLIKNNPQNKRSIFYVSAAIGSVVLSFLAIKYIF